MIHLPPYRLHKLRIKMRYLDHWLALPINIIKLIDPHSNAYVMGYIG